MPLNYIVYWVLPNLNPNLTKFPLTKNRPCILCRILQFLGGKNKWTDFDALVL